jgi:hypothetical protein
MIICPPGKHARFGPSYDGRLEVTRTWPGGKEEVCRECGEVFHVYDAREAVTTHQHSEVFEFWVEKGLVKVNA